MSDPAAPATAPAPEPAAPAQGNIVSEQEYRRPPPGDFPDLDSETRSVRQPALPPLPRAIELRGPEHWRTRIQEAGGPLVERDTAIAAALAAQATMAEGLAALEQARQTRDPRMHAAAHLEAVKAGYDRLLTEGARRRDAAMAALDARERELQVEADARTQLVPSEDVADIRAALLRMSPDKRSEALHKALTTGDTAVLAAVFSGRELSTGVSDVTRRSLKRRFEESKFPGLHGLRTGIQQARELAAKSFDELEALDDRVLGDAKALEEFRLQVQAADTAWYAFNRRLSGE